MEIVLFVLLAAASSALLYYGPGIVMRALARLEFYWIFSPANTFATAVSEEDQSGNGMQGGGHVVNALHGVVGWTLVKKAHDPMDWYFTPGLDPEHEKFLFKLYGIQPLGSAYWKLRMNVDRRLRFGREKDKPEGELKDVTRNNLTKNVFFTGELTVAVKEADTADKLGVNFEIDFAFRRLFPIRSTQRLADSAAFLTSLVEKAVNSATVGKPADAFIGGEETNNSVGTKANREQLIKDLENDIELSAKILEIIGIDIIAVSLRSVSMTPAHRALLELDTKAEREGNAKVKAAGKTKQERILLAEAREREEMVDVNVATAYFDNVLQPASENDQLAELVAIDRRMRGYENNKTVTTFAPGTDTMVPIGK